MVAEGPAPPPRVMRLGCALLLVGGVLLLPGQFTRLARALRALMPEDVLNSL